MASLADGDLKQIFYLHSNESYHSYPSHVAKSRDSTAPWCPKVPNPNFPPIWIARHLSTCIVRLRFRIGIFRSFPAIPKSELKFLFCFVFLVRMVPFCFVSRLKWKLWSTTSGLFVKMAKYSDKLDRYMYIYIVLYKFVLSVLFTFQS